VPLRGRLPVLAAALAVSLTGCAIFEGARTAPPASDMDGWTAGPSALEALTEVAVAVHDGRIWVAGGLDAGGRAVATVQVLDPATGVWELGPELPEPIHHATLASDGERVLLIGGYGSDGAARATVHALEAVAPLDGAWIEHVGLPAPRAAGAAAWDGAGRIVYAGGVGPDGVSGDVLVLVDRGWRELGALSEPREHLAATSDDAGTTYVMGGRRGGLDGNLAVVDVVAGDGVRRLGEVPTRRGGVAAFWWPALGACLVGGESPGGTNPQVECIDAGGRVTGLPDLARSRHGLGAVVVDGTAYVLLGGEQPGLFVSDAVELLKLP